MEAKVKKMEAEIEQLKKEKDFTNYVVQAVELITKLLELTIAVAAIIKLMNR